MPDGGLPVAMRGPRFWRSQGRGGRLALARRLRDRLGVAGGLRVRQAVRRTRRVLLDAGGFRILLDGLGRGNLLGAGRLLVPLLAGLFPRLSYRRRALMREHRSAKHIQHLRQFRPGQAPASSAAALTAPLKPPRLLNEVQDRVAPPCKIVYPRFIHAAGDKHARAAVLDDVNGNLRRLDKPGPCRPYLLLQRSQRYPQDHDIPCPRQVEHSVFGNGPLYRDNSIAEICGPEEQIVDLNDVVNAYGVFGGSRLRRRTPDFKHPGPSLRPDLPRRFHACDIGLPDFGFGHYGIVDYGVSEIGVGRASGAH